MKQGQFPAVIQLGDLNGRNGFKLDGENNQEWSGFSVDTVGDINDDGVADLLISARGFPSNSFKGRSYVVFGGPGIGSNGTMLLSNLNGANGFTLDGENTGDYSGAFVSAAGDINDDGVADLIIGAPFYPSGNGTGRSYVVFGGLGIGSNGTLALSSLTGANGFKLDGENNGDYSGVSVSAAGDINGDGIADLVIGASNYPGSIRKGRSYVVFGGPGVESNGTLALSSLTGVNGFKLDGENNGDRSGISVSTAGDINGDGVADLLIGAHGYPKGNYTGRSYVVFGRVGVGSNGTMALSSLNGADGFQLDGENEGDYSGWFVSAAGDINGDGVADLVIGASYYPGGNGRGRSYVVFGGAGAGGNGTLALSSLTGANGFKLDGENNNDRSGISVSTAGDINGDGVADLVIGASHYLNDSNKGRSYVVFGSLKLDNSGTMSLSSLNGVNGFKLDGENNNDYSGYSVSSAGDINGDGIADLLIGANGHPEGNFTGRTYVVFGDAPPVLVNNRLSLSVGTTITLNSTLLAAYDRNHNNNTLVFVPGAVEHGQFEVTGIPGISLTNFTQQQVVGGIIQFVHDGSLVAPSYDITVHSNGIAWTGPVSAKVDFTGAPPSYFPEILLLESLNGQNGFKIDGEASGDDSGSSVNAAGDFNGDGCADLLIGAFGHANSIGRSYVVFGSSGIGQSGLLSLSNLNGANGFQIDGEVAGEISGYSVSTAGDINQDGYADLMVGAPLYSYTNNTYAGRNYIIFGGASVGSSGLLMLSGINGTNGFIFEGVNQDQVGVALRPAGDLNNDDYLDLVFGAYGHVEYNNTFTGWIYVLFGGPNLGGGGLISALNLNGLNGFILNAEPSGNASQTGRWVNGVGDVNGDGYADLIIGAPSYNDSLGRSYVVFGHSRLGSNKTLELSMLNGTNGFKLTGEMVGDVSGIVYGPGDINGDGYDDLLIGACYHNNRTGRSYVIFGKPTLGNSSEIFLADLNGTNGFKIDGESPGDESGLSQTSLGPLGDINADGYADIAVSAYGHNNTIGRSYILLGGPQVGSGGLLSLSELDGTNGFKIDGEIAGGVGNYYSTTGIGDINNDGVSDFGIGTSTYNNNIGRTYIIFGDIPPTLVQNRLTLQSGSQVLLNSTFLSAYDRNHNNGSLIFFSTNITHSYFESIGQPGIPLTNFTQPQLLNGTIQFVHDGSAFAPSYNITVRSDGIAWTGPHAANITFIPAPTTTPIPSTSTSSLTPTPTSTPTISISSPTPTSSTPTFTSTPAIATTPAPTSTPRAPIVLTNNQLPITNGGQVILSPLQLQASKAGFNNSQLLFLVGDVQNGYFTFTTQNTTRLMTFTQAQIDRGDITFVHTGDGQAPSYQVMVTDGMQYTVPSVPAIYFTDAPMITENTLTLQPGETVTLTPSNLNVTITDGSTLGQVICRIEDLQHALITQLPGGLPVSNFTLADLQSGKIQVTQDNSNYATVSYVIACGGQKGISSVPSTVDTHFSYQGVRAPQLLNNYLLIKQGESVPLTVQNIHATQNGSQPLSGGAFFYISTVTHGQFSLSSVPGSIVTFFSQEQLQNGSVVFTQDNSKQAPGYRLSVRALGLESASLPAAVIFQPVNQPPELVHSLKDQTATVGTPFSCAIPAGSFIDPEDETMDLLASRFNSSLPLPDWLRFDALNARFTGTPVTPDFIDVNVTARDPHGLTATTDFILTVRAAPADPGLSTWQKSVIGAIISGGIGIGFVLVQICLKRIANKKLMQILGQGDTAYERDVVRPVMKDITGRIKISRFMNAITNKELMAFKGAVRSLLSALERRQVDLNFSEMKESKKDEVINEIGNQTYRWMKAQQRGCAKCCPGLHAFFKPQITADDLQGAVEEIADNVAHALQKPTHRPQPSLSAKLSVSGSPVYKEHKRKSSRELSQVELDSPPSPSGKPAGVEVHGDLSSVQLG